MTNCPALYHDFMATLNLSDVIKLIPDSKLNWSSDCIDDAEFDVENLLANPLDFPALNQAILDEDVICIPVEPGIPEFEQVVTQTIVELCAMGIAASNVTVLLGEGTRKTVVESLLSHLEESRLDDCQVLVHDSTSKELQGFLGPSESGDPIILNARLVHADFVLPIARYQSSGWKSQIDFLYPYFSDVDSQKRFFKLNERHRVALNGEVNKWLGACFRVVCALREDVKQAEDRIVGFVLAGEPGSVQNAIADRLAKATARTPSTVRTPAQTYDLVVAQVRSHTCLSIEEMKQTLDALVAKCNRGGALVVLLDDGQEIPRLVDSKSGDFENEFDFVSVFVATEQTKLNGLGLSRIHAPAELERLVEQYESVLILPDSINEHSDALADKI